MFNSKHSSPDICSYGNNFSVGEDVSVRLNAAEIIEMIVEWVLIISNLV